MQLTLVIDSFVETLVMIRSVKPISASSAGTKQPNTLRGQLGTTNGETTAAHRSRKNGTYQGRVIRDESVDAELRQSISRGSCARSELNAPEMNDCKSPRWRSMSRHFSFLKGVAHLEVPAKLPVLSGVGHFRLVGDCDQVAELREVDDRELAGKTGRHFLRDLDRDFRLSQGVFVSSFAGDVGKRTRTSKEPRPLYLRRSSSSVASTPGRTQTLPFCRADSSQSICENIQSVSKRVTAWKERLKAASRCR
ncbi:hypothetical protein OF846_003939 [Rhodotorula toruloides]|nr:hypothetical protein OF846_003939 [Rhodotorula toruloides]